MKRPALLRIRPVVAPAAEAVDAAALDARLSALREDGRLARRLDQAVEQALGGAPPLSELTANLALEYLERLAPLVQSLSPELGVHAISRAYVAHAAVEADPARYGAGELPLLSLPAPRGGRPPQDLLVRVVKAARRRFAAHCGLPERAWEGFALAVVHRVHEATLDPEEHGLVAPAVVEDLARVGWLLRQVDLRYGLQPPLP